MKTLKKFTSIILGSLVCLTSCLPVMLGKCDIRHISPLAVGVYSIVSTLVLLWGAHFSFHHTKAQRISASILAVIFSQFITLGRYFEQHYTFLRCFTSNTDCFIWAIQSIVYGYVIYKIALLIFAFCEKNHSSSLRVTTSLKKWFAIILGIRILYFFAFYPCVFGFDAVVGLRTFLDPECATCSHHPFFIQLTHGLFYTIGEKIGHLSVGFGLLSLLLIFISSAILVYGINLFCLSNVKKEWIIAIGIIYAVLPIFPYLSVYPTKDGIFAYFFLLYLFTIYEIFLTRGKCLTHVKFLCLHFVAGLIICLSRHQGSIIFAIECITLLFCYKNYWKHLLPCSALVLLCLFFFEKTIVPRYNVEPAGKQETYGPLFQQTAYCLLRFPEDVTEEERASINLILDCDTIVKKYEFAKTDAVKNTYKYNPWYRVTPKAPSMFRHIERTGEAEGLKSYRQTWAAMFLRHPLTHLEASAAVFWGFFYNMGQQLIYTEPTWAENTNATTDAYRFWHVNKVAQIILNKRDIITQTPILNWVGAVPYYNWVAILLFFVLLYRRDWKGFGMFLPVLLSLGILTICPVAFGRYTYPIVVALPFLFIYILSSTKKCLK